MQDGLPLREIFHDLQPIEQHDGDNPVCSIKYSEEFVETMNYLRAVLRKDERSERSLHLTKVCLELNPANYTTWHFRRNCLAAISSQQQQNTPESRASATNVAATSIYDETLVDEDLKMAAALGGPNPKNYQIWYHRRALLECLISNKKETDATRTELSSRSVDIAERELNYVTAVLEVDAKNYHAWSHRQWILRTAHSPKLFEEELAQTHSFILTDPRNNSAWNQRWFTTHCYDGNNLDRTREAEYALQGADIDPFNESPWRYLLGILREKRQQEGNNKEGTTTMREELQSHQERVASMTEKLHELGEDCCCPMVAAHIDILEMMGNADSLHKAAAMAHALATEHDRTRMKYWLMREKQLRSS